ncbi:putative phage abortive infection protein [Aliarcobacter vitoriensis]|uniref:Phage abortive infection protein n=1 Tax=Aliarcobacter vitoriensis TaxID=2011099 RepID=A0A366MQ33_9BACT|nr:putative phage abortive infection protein [Aliarcobacter vitoriensis]RBQ28398.1 hypothetical protein CRU91_09260 [Aliarcobacter vitoriensis]
MEENKKDLDFLDKIYSKLSNTLNDEGKTRKSLFYIFIIALCIIGSIFLIELILVICLYDIDKLGAFGDFFGGMINPLLTFCTFMALLMTIILQQKELSLTREELSETKQATKDSAEALREQSNSIKLQNFENTFFNMIRLHNEIVNNLRFGNHFIDYVSETEVINGFPHDTIKFDLIKRNNESNTSIFGRDSIEKICNNIDDFIENKSKTNSFNKNRKPTLIYDLIHQCYSDIIGHYFGNIYQILKFISTNEIEDKRKYSDLFRAQFSSKELKLLFYHCSASIGSTRFKLLIEEFEFLEHLNIEKENEFFKYIFYKSIYDIKAFGIKNKYIVESLSSEIQDKINSEIQDKINSEIGSPENKKNNQHEYKYKYLDFYKYFSNEELEQYLQLLKKEPSDYLNKIDTKLAILDYSPKDVAKNYTL